MKQDAHLSEGKALFQELSASKAAENAQTAKISLEMRQEKASSALEALNLQEESARIKREALESIASDGEKGIVSRNKAKAELTILLSGDPITLRTARIQQEAAVKKMTAAAKKAEETDKHIETALQRATHTRKEAIRLKASALVAAKKAEDEMPSARTSFNKISETLDEITKKKRLERVRYSFFKVI